MAKVNDVCVDHIHACGSIREQCTMIIIMNSHQNVITKAVEAEGGGREGGRGRSTRQRKPSVILQGQPHMC